MFPPNNLPSQPPPTPPHNPDGPKVPVGPRHGRMVDYFSAMSSFARPGYPPPTPPQFPDGPRAPAGPPKGRAASHTLMAKPPRPIPPPPTGPDPNVPLGYGFRNERYVGSFADSDAKYGAESTSWIIQRELILYTFPYAT